MKKLFIVFFLLGMVGCTTEPEKAPEEELMTFDARVAQDKNRQAVDGVHYFQDSEINFSFTTELPDDNAGKEKVRLALETISSQLDGCLSFTEVFAIEESFDGTGKQKGATIEIVGDTDNRVSQFVTKFDVPDNYVSQYGEEVIHRHFAYGGLLNISETQMEVNFTSPFDWDIIDVKYISFQPDLEGNQRRVGLESNRYGEYKITLTEEDEIKYVKIRPERLSFGIAPADAPDLYAGSASLGKDYGESIFSDHIMLREDLDVDFYVRVIAYKLGDEGSSTGNVDWEFLKSVYCN